MGVGCPWPPVQRPQLSFFFLTFTTLFLRRLAAFIGIRLFLERFQRMIDMKEAALKHARDQEIDFVFFVDADNFILPKNGNWSVTGFVISVLL